MLVDVAVLASPSYSDTCRFVERNQGGGRSYALEEILLPCPRPGR